MKIFLVASECVPFIKTGGLADVVGALPAALKRLGAEVSVLIPKYSMIPQQFRKEMQHITDFSIQLGWRKQYIGVEKIHREGIDFYFADNEFYFKQDYVYSSGDFEAERYCWFSKAAKAGYCAGYHSPERLANGHDSAAASGAIFRIAGILPR